MTKCRFGASLDIRGNEILNARLENLDGYPEEAPAGRIVYVDGYAAVGNGVTYDPLVKGHNSDYQSSEEKNQPNGYAGLDENAKIPVGLLFTENDTNGVVVLSAPVQANQYLVWDGEKWVGFTPTNVYVYRGTVQSYEQLPEGATAGDVYNVVNAHGNFPAGTNYAWNGTEWDPLGGWVDLSPFQTIANLVTTFGDAPDDTHYPSAKLVKDNLDTLKATVDTKLDAIDPVEGGEYTKITFGDDGLVRSGTTLDPEDIPDLSGTYVTTIRIGAADGVAPLDGTGKVPYELLPDKLAQVYVPQAQKGVAGGVATLDDGAHIPTAQIPDLSEVYATQEDIADCVHLVDGKIPVDDLPDLSGAYIPLDEKGQASGVATLGSDGKVPMAQLNAGMKLGQMPVVSSSVAGSPGQVLVVSADGAGVSYYTLPKAKVYLGYEDFTVEGDDTQTSWSFSTAGFEGRAKAVTVMDATTGEVQYPYVVIDTGTVHVTFREPPLTGETFVVSVIGMTKE